MKKLFLTLAAVTLAIAANAQVYFGGQVGLNRDTDDNNTTVQILPEIGYTFNDQLSLGTVVGYGYNYNNGDKTHMIEFSPYLRYTYASLGPVHLFCDLNGDFTYYKWDPEVGKNDDDTYWHAYLKPGIALPVSDNLSFVSHIGQIGYDDADGQFDVDFSGNAITIGVYYNF